MSFFSDVLGLLKHRKEKQKLEHEIEQLKAEAQERKSLIQKPTPEEVQSIAKDRDRYERGRHDYDLILGKASARTPMLFVFLLGLIVVIICSCIIIYFLRR